MSQAVIRIRNVKIKASMWLPISAGVVGELAMAVTEPTERERPNIRSASVSILERGRFSVACCCCNPACEGRSEFGLLARCDLRLVAQPVVGRSAARRRGAEV